MRTPAVSGRLYPAERGALEGQVRALLTQAAARPAALNATRADLVDSRHSGWATADDSTVVGYAGVVIT